MSILRRFDPTIKPLWSQRRVLALALALGVMLGGLVLVGAWSATLSERNCHRVAHIDLIIQQLGQRGLRTIGVKGSAGYAYYRTHPDELRIARNQLEQQIHDFTPNTCSLF